MTTISAGRSTRALASTLFCLLTSGVLAAPPPSATPVPEPAPAIRQAEQIHRLTLDQCIRIALDNSANVLKGENNLSLNGEQVLQSYAQFLPNLVARGGYGYSSGTNLYSFSGLNLVNQHAFNPSFSVGTQLNIFNGLSDYSGLKLALAKREASQLSLAWARQQVILDIIQTFLQVVLDQKLLEIADKNLAASRGRLKLLQGQTEVGAASIADLYRQQAQTSSDELLLSNTQARLNDDLTILIRKLRVDPRKTYELEIPKLTPEPSVLGGRPLEELIQLALDRRNDVKAQSLTVKSNDWSITQARSGYFPKLDLLFTRSAAGTRLTQQIVNGVDVLPANQQSQWSQLANQVTYAVSLNLTWTLFDRFVTRYNVAAARTTWENSQIDQKEIELQSIADVRIAYSDFKIAQDQLKSAEVGLKAAQEALQAITGRFSVGAASFIDVLTSQTALVQAQSNQAQAIVNLKLREKALAYATGTLTP